MKFLPKYFPFKSGDSYQVMERGILLYYSVKWSDDGGFSARPQLFKTKEAAERWIKSQKEKDKKYDSKMNKFLAILGVASIIFAIHLGVTIGLKPALVFTGIVLFALIFVDFLMP